MRFRDLLQTGSHVEESRLVSPGRDLRCLLVRRHHERRYLRLLACQEIGNGQDLDSRVVALPDLRMEQSRGVSLKLHLLSWLLQCEEQPDDRLFAFYGPF